MTNQQIISVRFLTSGRTYSYRINRSVRVGQKFRVENWRGEDIVIVTDIGMPKDGYQGPFETLELCVP